MYLNSMRLKNYMSCQFDKVCLFYTKIYIFQAISKNDEGLYSCYSRGVRKDNVKRHTVNVLVQQDFEDVYEHNYNVSLIIIRIFF